MLSPIFSKTELARVIDVSRSSLYYKPQKELDHIVKEKIEQILTQYPYYGHRRVANVMGIGKHRAIRIMRKYNLGPFFKKKKRKYTKKLQPLRGYENEINNTSIVRPNQIWCTDFTYLSFQKRFTYLATVLDIFTREIVGVSIAQTHDRFLVVGALVDAIERYGVPDIIHSDCGSEYESEAFDTLAKAHGIIISRSAIASPWQNGYQESFYGRFKEELGDITHFRHLGELIEYIYQRIYDYNHKRIHSAFKDTPNAMRQKFQNI